MSLAAALADFNANVAQCDNLIANAHQNDPNGVPILPALDREQITVAAFLNLFISWEMFLEDSLAKLMSGEPTINGSVPTKYVAPPNSVAAKKMLIGVMRHFDYANHGFVRQMVAMYFQNGIPFEPHLAGIDGDLSDLRTMRNASAHISSTTQQALESLATRIFGNPVQGISLYQLLTSDVPGSSPNETVFAYYKNKLLIAANLIATG